LKAIAGTDAALYIIFNRYAAIFFFFVTIFNFIVFLPLYVTGKPKDKKDIEDTNGDTILIALLTSINIGGNRKQIAIYTLIMILYTFGALVFMYHYWKKSTHWRHRKHSH
jgi:hypothetical protein